MTTAEAVGATLVVIAIALRFFEFWELPGINGDEAWYGVQALRLTGAEPVNWRTPTGNLLSPAQLLPLWLMHHVVDPAPWLLRVPSLAAGVLQIAVAWWFVHRSFGRAAGITAAVMVAVLPVNMAYARFGWDPSHVGLWSTLAAGAAMERRPFWMAVAFAVALWVHPTSVFIAPFLGATFVGALLNRSLPWKRTLAFSLLALGLLGVVAAGVKLVTRGDHVPSFRAIVKRLGSLAEWGTFAERLANFYLGDATYEYVTGTGYRGPAGLWVAVFWAVAAAVLIVGGWRMVRGRSFLAAGLVFGALATHVAFFAVAGPSRLAPHVERFGLVLATPAILAAVACLFAPEARAPTNEARHAGARRVVIVSLVGACLLAGFVRWYLIELRTTGSTSHPTFWTGRIEPKALAARRILGMRDPGRPAIIVTDGWWTSWIIRYLTAGVTDVTVTSDAKLVKQHAKGGAELFVVGFPGGKAKQWTSHKGTAAQFERQDIPGYGRAAALSLWRRR